MCSALETDWGNPSSVHAFGRAARRRVGVAREQVAALIGALPTEVFFTSGGTEGDNWALRVAAQANRHQGNHIVTAATEHQAVLATCAALEKEGWRVTYVPIEPVTGLVRAKDLAESITAETTVVSIAYVNNEIGTVQDIPALAATARACNPAVVFHTDAVQAAGLLPLDAGALNVDLLTLSGHKIYGPKGIGALWMRRGFRFGALFYGGNQERKLRPGTENVAGIVGFGEAANLACREREQRVELLRRLRDRFIQGVSDRIPTTRLNGPDPLTQPDQRHPGNANLSFPGLSGEALLRQLDMQGIAVSAGSACSSGSVEPSHVLLAIGRERADADSAVRFSFGLGNNEADIDYIITELANIVAKLSDRPPQVRN